MENYTGDNLHLFVEGFADGGSDPEAAIDFMAWYQPRVSVYKTFYEEHKDSYRWGDELPILDYWTYSNLFTDYAGERNEMDEQYYLDTLLDECCMKDGYKLMINNGAGILPELCRHGVYENTISTLDVDDATEARIMVNVIYGSGVFELVLQDQSGTEIWSKAEITESGQYFIDLDELPERSMNLRCRAVSGTKEGPYALIQVYYYSKE